MGMPAERASVFVLDCADAQMLADFYAKLLGSETQPGRDPDFVEVVDRQGVVRLAVRRDHGYAPPSWPRPEDSQQAHLRIFVPDGDLDAAERDAISLGATPIDARDDTGRRDVRMYTDPAGHSFLLTTQ